MYYVQLSAEEKVCRKQGWPSAKSFAVGQNPSVNSKRGSGIIGNAEYLCGIPTKWHLVDRAVHNGVQSEERIGERRLS